MHPAVLEVFVAFLKVCLLKFLKKITDVFEVVDIGHLGDKIGGGHHSGDNFGPLPGKFPFRFGWLIEIG